MKYPKVKFNVNQHRLQWFKQWADDNLIFQNNLENYQWYANGKLEMYIEYNYNYSFIISIMIKYTQYNRFPPRHYFAEIN